jgi:hypothetical protein
VQGERREATTQNLLNLNGLTHHKLLVRKGRSIRAGAIAGSKSQGGDACAYKPNHRGHRDVSRSISVFRPHVAFPSSPRRGGPPPEVIQLLEVCRLHASKSQGKRKDRTHAQNRNSNDTETKARVDVSFRPLLGHSLLCVTHGRTPLALKLQDDLNEGRWKPGWHALPRRRIWQAHSKRRAICSRPRPQ